MALAYELPEWAEVITDPSAHIGERVHVAGWNPGAVFVLVSCSGGRSNLRTPAKRKVYTTTNPLYLTRR